MAERNARARIALVAGTLAQGGAEKQFTYMAEALFRAGVEVRVYSLTGGEHFEWELQAHGIPLRAVGTRASRLRRLAALVREMSAFQPDLMQASHSYVNPYVALVGKICGAVSVGAIRNDGVYEAHAHGCWRRFVLHGPSALLVNSAAARHNLEAFGVPATRMHLIRNVIDLQAFERAVDGAGAPRLARPCVVAIARLAREKRLDRFLAALELARRQVPELTGYIVGEGPLREELEFQATELGLGGGALQFLGAQSAIPALLSQASALVLTSTQEGTPNVVLEAMAARRAVITTAAGDAAVLVRDGQTGYVVPFDDAGAMSNRIVQVVSSPQLALRLGMAGYSVIQREHDVALLPGMLIRTYEAIAREAKQGRLLHLLEGARAGGGFPACAEAR